MAEPEADLAEFEGCMPPSEDETFEMGGGGGGGGGYS